jgi:DNA invertase Pin-like site-specific DNA recombinase
MLGRLDARHRQETGPTGAKSYKGRKPPLTKEQVKEIHRRVVTGEQKTGLAAEYGVSRQTLYSALA